MLRIIYIEHSGQQHEVEVNPGGTVMEAAARNNIPGIVAECGGVCACATCHVIVGDEWAATVGPPSEMEASMLDFAHDPQPKSRLSCQIQLREELDGLVVHMPEKQG